MKEKREKQISTYSSRYERNGMPGKKLKFIHLKVFKYIFPVQYVCSTGHYSYSKSGHSMEIQWGVNILNASVAEALCADLCLTIEFV